MGKESGADVDSWSSLVRSDRLHLALVVMLLWSLYLLTAPRTVVLEDDGLFILSSWFLGIEHPPGYPLFVLLGKLATLWPFGSPAWRMHAMSGLFGALACGVLFVVARLLIPGRAPAYLAALGLGVSATFWSQAIIADVYSLHALILFALLLLSLLAYRAAVADVDLGRLPAATALTAGLGLANHWPLLLLSAPGLLFLWWPALPRLWRRLPLLLFWFALGLLPYAWMVWRSQMQPMISFQGPIDTWAEFVDYFLRSGYSGVDNSKSADVGDKLLYFSFLVREAGRQLLLPGALLALVGFGAQWRRWGSAVSAALTVAFVGPTFLLLLLLNFDYDPIKREAFSVYPTAAWGVFALWAGLGLHLVAACLAAGYRAAASGAATALLLLVSLALHWPDNDRSGDWLGRGHAEAMLAGLAPNALLLVHGDMHIPTTAYLHLVEGMRPDVLLLSKLSLILEPKLFDPYALPKDAQQRALDAYLRGVDRPVYGILAPGLNAGTMSWLLYRPRRPTDTATAAGLGIPEALAATTFQLTDAERVLLKRMLAHGAFRDGWSESLRRILLEAFARFQALAEQARQWPDDDPALQAMVMQVLDLPEGALARASVLSEFDVRGHDAEIQSLMERFAAHAGDPWISKRQLALYFNVVARRAQFAGQHELARKALARSLEYWPDEANPALTAEASYRRIERAGFKPKVE